MVWQTHLHITIIYKESWVQNFQISVGGLKYTGNLKNLVTSYYFEETYWHIFTQRRKYVLPEIENSTNLSNTVTVGCQSSSPLLGFESVGGTSELVIIFQLAVGKHRSNFYKVGNQFGQGRRRMMCWSTFRKFQLIPG